MYIKKLKVANFRSIECAEINFSPLSMIVGANASGKSNLINVFRFIENIVADGIDNAIALQGGTSYLTNVRAGKGTPIEIGFSLDLSDEGWVRKTQSKNYASEIKSIDYNFSILPNKRGNGYRISEDHLLIIFNCCKVNFSASGPERFEALDANYSLDFFKKNAGASYQLRTNIDEISNEELKDALLRDHIAELFLRFANENKYELMLSRISILLPPCFSDNTFIRIFDFDPKELKKSSLMVSTKILSEDGANIASVLHEILRRKDSKEKLTVLLKQYLPYVNGISVESNIDKSFSYKVNEKYSKRNFHPSFLSDGTVSILALIIALYFEEQSNIIILEEPERNIHPKLLASLLSSAEDVSKEKQIIITTHNPEFLKHAKIRNVRLVSRNDEGNTIVTEPASSAMVNTFMENDLGLDDLFLQNMLGE